MSHVERLRQIVEPVIAGLGYELVRVTLGSGRRPVLQIMAERPDHTMGVEDCARISRELSAALDVEDPIAGEYMLEVSSPGIDRPLTREKDFAVWAGFEARVELKNAADGRKRLKGRLAGIRDGAIALEAEDGVFHFPFADVEKAKLILTDDLIAAMARQAMPEENAEKGV